ncbi:hypothetical protein LF817_11045 [Halobacillus sp. A1]|uniref:hypothetical protein n=1 Tax=Halobacillus sp. A1 TaxID=2880262 RepID=UPI0020A6A11F|nr:hypothetical protein [Halobacillus sp. A1]MCP3031880.1 hypothetical protein [Halobacillus sp. A1]
MDAKTRTQFENLESKEKQTQYDAFTYIMEVSKVKVDWAYEVWDRLLEDLEHKDPHRGSRAAQFLVHLAISDPDERILGDFSKIWAVTKDPKFVTARHSLQAIWRIGLAGKKQKDLIMKHFESRFLFCIDEKNYTLTRLDIIEGLSKLYIERQEEDIKEKAQELIENVSEEKYKKKYSKLLKGMKDS